MLQEFQPIALPEHAIAAVMPGIAEFVLMNFFFIDVSEALASFITGSRIDARFTVQSLINNCNIN